MNKFNTFCLDNNLFAPHPLTGETQPPNINATLLCFYAEWLTKNGISTYDSVYQYLSAIRTYCRNNDLPDPTTSDDGSPNPQYFGCMRGIKRVLKKDDVKRTPITIRMLKLIHEAATSNIIPEIDQHTGLNVITAASFMFFLLLRVGEATSNSKSFDPSKHATREDVTFINNTDGTISHVNFSIKVSKTFQFRRGFIVTLHPTNTPTCPVSLLSKLFKQQPRPPTSPLFDFRTPNERGKGERVHASRTHLTKAINTCLEIQNVDTTTIKMHSFRQGGASAALASNCPTWMLEILGRWKSTAWKRYAFLGNDKAKAITQAMANAPETPGSTMEDISPSKKHTTSAHPSFFFLDVHDGCHLRLHQGIHSLLSFSPHTPLAGGPQRPRTRGPGPQTPLSS